MAKIIPFRAIRPAADKVHLVATRSYVSYSQINLRRKLIENPYSFIHVINPEFSMNIKPVKGVSRFPLVREKYLEFVAQGILQQDATPAFYIYRQIQPNDSFTGIICGISNDDYLNGTIKVHEQTLTRREKLFKHYLDVCNFNAEPVLLTYRDDSLVEQIISETMSQNTPAYDFSTTDKMRHQLWLIDNPKSIEIISQQFSHKNSIYIADGHHRSASSSLLGKDRKKKNRQHNGCELYNYLMAYLVPESQLTIYDFNRVVKDLNGHSPEEFLRLLSVDFNVAACDEIYQPERLHNFSMYLNKRWYSLQLKTTPPKDCTPVESLDAQILSDKVLNKILNIKDLKTDSRIEFVSGKAGMTGLKSYADKKKMAVAFGLFPVTTAQLKAVADANEIMPPKTTWIEPKLRSGLTIFSFDE
jgi:uncharacterized protein (DUF1015 family)